MNISRGIKWVKQAGAVLTVAGFCVLAGSAPAHADLLVNGGFEGTTGWTFNGVSDSNTFTNTNSDIITTQAGPDFALFHNGNVAADLSVTQTFNVPTTANYIFSFWEAADTIPSNDFQVIFGGVNASVGTVFGPTDLTGTSTFTGTLGSGATFNYNHIVIPVMLTAGSTTLTFDMPDGAGAVGVDTASIINPAAAPEVDASTAALPAAIVAGLLFLLVDKRRTA